MPGQAGCEPQMLDIGCPDRACLWDSQHVQTAATQSNGYGSSNMFIRVELD